MNLQELTILVKDQFKLNIYGDHGIRHWKRVEEIGLYLSQFTKAYAETVRLFALLHDSQRDGYVDPDHGLRASIFVEKLYKEGKLQISHIQLRQLVFACKHHSDSSVKSEDITIQTCWDSDRLDLWRVDKTPDPAYMNTAIAKNPETIKFAYDVFLRDVYSYGKR